MNEAELKFNEFDHLRSIWYRSEPSEVSNSTNNKLVDNFMSTEFRSGFRK